MSGELILWTHALAALLFGAVALTTWRRPVAGAPRLALAAALGTTALWALAIAGIDPHDVAIQLAQSCRDLAWLVFMLQVARRQREGWAVTAVHVTLIAVVVATAGVAVAESALPAGPAQAALTGGRVLFRMMAAAGALVLVHRLYVIAPARGGTRLVALALGMVWAADLLLFSAAFASDTWPAALVVTRGAAVVAAALLFAAAAGPEATWAPALSRPAAARMLAVLALAGYVATAAAVAQGAYRWGGDLGRALQAGVACGAAAALLALISTPWLRAWARVKLAKHLFRHRYDYRVEWQRFAETLAGADRDAAPLEMRVVEATATLLDAPAGALLVPDGTGLSIAAAWRWPGLAAIGRSDALARHLAASWRIIEIDTVRAGTAGENDAAALPAALRDDPQAWALVPLAHGGALAGAVLLARPPVERALDWEDLDLLRVAGPQAASYLAEQRAHAALAEARRFDEFHRRFAFILHDLKNLASQQLLVARNAERHAANPDFRADMVATLKDSADRMTTLLARLSHHEPARAEALCPVDVAALVRRLTAARRAQHRVETDAPAAAWAHAHPQRLEQVLAHLVQNAADASAPNDAVTIAVTVHDGTVTVAVADRGAGMTAQFVREQLFTPFASSKPGGFGLGAYEARQLVDAMGGEVTVESRAGEGTVMRVTLPTAPALEVAA